MSIKEKERSQEDIDKENDQKHFATVISAFSDYEIYSIHELKQLENNFSKLESKYKEHLPKYEENFKNHYLCIVKNYNFILKMLYPHLQDRDEVNLTLLTKSITK